MSATAAVPPACLVGVALPLVVLAAVALWMLLSRSSRFLTAIIMARPRGRGGASKEARLPPGTFGWPLVGETLDFVSCAYSSRPEAFVDKHRLL
jgi:steroid 3-oxidase